MSFDISKLTPNQDAIAFEFKYRADDKPSIEIATISSVDERFGVLVHFLYGYKSMGEWIKPEDIVAVINEKGEPDRILGWRCNVAQMLKPDVWAKYKR